MTSQLEIEFKTLLTKEEFHTLIHALHLKKAVTQTNYYFDDNKETLHHQKAALRIRELDHKMEMTLKSKTKEGHLEITELLNEREYQNFKIHHVLPKKQKIEQKLQQYHTQLSLMVPITQLTTTRFEKKLNNDCTIMIDHSCYYNKEDFELEMEVSDYKQGKAYFQHFLNHFALPYRQSQPKIARAISAKCDK